MSNRFNYEDFTDLRLRLDTLENRFEDWIRDYTASESKLTKMIADLESALREKSR